MDRNRSADTVLRLRIRNGTIGGSCAQPAREPVVAEFADVGEQVVRGSAVGRDAVFDRPCGRHGGHAMGAEAAFPVVMVVEDGTNSAAAQCSGGNRCDAGDFAAEDALPILDQPAFPESL